MRDPDEDHRVGQRGGADAYVNRNLEKASGEHGPGVEAIEAQLVDLEEAPVSRGARRSASRRSRTPQIFNVEHQEEIVAGEAEDLHAQLTDRAARDEPAEGHAVDRISGLHGAQWRSDVAARIGRSTPTLKELNICDKVELERELESGQGRAAPRSPGVREEGQRAGQGRAADPPSGSA